MSGPESADASPATPGDLLECDVIFRGGVTSGVIYPGTAAGLAERYRFVQIGGASAGAIAAGIAAAAEYARQFKGDKQAFSAVQNLAIEVSGGEGSQTTLETLFRAQPAVWVLDRLMWQGFRFGAWVPGLMLAIPALAGWSIALLCGLGISVALNFAFAGAIFSAVVLGLQIAVALPRSGFGLCSGINPSAPQTQDGLRKQGALMDWIHATVQRLAHRSVGNVGPQEGPTGIESIPIEDRPLTMGDLWGSLTPKAARRIDMVLTTTNLSQQLPHQFPFLERRPGGDLYFCADEIARFVPRDIARWLIAAARPLPSRFQSDGRTFLRLPEPQHLPVVLGIRLSLSFPGLIAAVPLYAEDFTARLRQKRTVSDDAPAGAKRLRRCWFSDGGITSNFPIHLFDSVLPTRPTFGVDLRDAPNEVGGAQQNDDPAVREAVGTNPLIWLPQSNKDDLAPGFFDEFNSMLGFVMAIVSTARNGQENELMMMPGHRDRVVHIETTPKEGGLNLHMSADTIKILSDRGLEAARLLCTRFDPHGKASQMGFGMNWRNHRWIRFRSAMASLERVLGDFERAWRTDTQGSYDFATYQAHWDPNDPLNARSVPAGKRATPSYRWPNRASAGAAAAATGEILDLARRLRQAASAFDTPDGGVGSVFDHVSPPDSPTSGGAPLPKLGLKARPTGEDPRRMDTYPR